MAKSLAAFTLAGLLAALAGCQQQMMVESLPPQNFGGPSLAARPAPAPPAPAPVAVAPRPPSPKSGPSVFVPREWGPAAAARPWRYIVIHHSATPTGGALAFDRMHRSKGWDELGYHFVVGNGTETRDGQVEVGARWPTQKHGAHTKTPDNRFNDYGIGICVVGNFDLTNPSAEQMKSVSRLVAYLMRTYRITPDRILGHGQAKPTDCPGKYMSIAEIRRQSGRVLADAGEEVQPPATPIMTSLLYPIPTP